MRKSIEVIVAPTDILDSELSKVRDGCNNFVFNEFATDKRKISAWQ